MKVKGNEVLWESQNKNVVVTYNVFAMGDKYNVYNKLSYSPLNIYEEELDDHITWEYCISFGTFMEAISYAKKIRDELIVR